MGHTFLINTPMIFRGAWAVIKGFMDEETRNKIKMLGTDYMETLKDFVEMDNLPSFLGGNCECEGGCLIKCSGPWDDYEIHGKGIRLKGSGDAAVEDGMAGASGA